jgi:hypothetical protein
VDETTLIERLRRIEALHAGATSVGECPAAAEGRKRIQRRLEKLVRSDPAIEFRFTLADGWSRRLLVGPLPPLRRRSVLHALAPPQRSVVARELRGRARNHGEAGVHPSVPSQK